jgi:hypothetical protein
MADNFPKVVQSRKRLAAAQDAVERRHQELHDEWLEKPRPTR